jgi:4-amino-4-deoxychorismate mutase
MTITDFSETASVFPNSVLEGLRATLDGIDESLLATIRERIDCCVRIAHHKRQHGVPMMQPHRIDVVQRRAARFADQNGLDPAFLSRLYDVIIAETCLVESVIIDDPQP